MPSPHYPNRFARGLLLAMQEVMGKHGLDATLGAAGLERTIDQFPPDTLERVFPFSALAALNTALDTMYDTRGGRGMALRAGRVWFARGLHNFGALAGVNDPAFRALALDARCQVALGALAEIFTRFSDQTSRLELTPNQYRFIVDPSPFAWERTSERPVCHVLVGLLQESVRWAANGRDYAVRETQCQAAGADTCVFTINRQPLA